MYVFCTFKAKGNWNWHKRGFLIISGNLKNHFCWKVTQTNQRGKSQKSKSEWRMEGGGIGKVFHPSFKNPLAPVLLLWAQGPSCLFSTYRTNLRFPLPYYATQGSWIGCQKSWKVLQFRNYQLWSFADILFPTPSPFTFMKRIA